MGVFINYNDKRWKKYDVDFTKIVNLALGAKYKKSDVSIVLTNDVEIHKLNREYRGMDKATNVLSFELGDPILLGDIYISIDTVLREATAQNISVQDHIAHLVVHGALHLIGFDHIDDACANVMEAREIKMLKKIGIKNPYEDVTVGRSGFYKTKFLQYFVLFLLGAVASLGFAPFYLWFMALPAIAVAYGVITRRPGRKSVWMEFLFALPFAGAYAISMFWWMLNSIYVVPELAAQFAIWTIPAILSLGFFGGIIFSVPFIVVRRVHCVPVGRPVLFAAVWSLVLWLREWLFTGFPWNPIANVTFPWTALANSMSVIGALGLTFLIVWGVTAIVELALNIKSKLCWISVVKFFVLILLCAFLGARNIRQANIQEHQTPIIRIVQPAKTQAQKMGVSRADAYAQALRNMDNLLRMAQMPGDVDLIVLPETSYPFVVVDNDFEFSKTLSKPVLFGATSYFDGRAYNSFIVANDIGQISDIYHKSHLVPFGEYSPLGIMPSPANLAAGSGARLISMPINDDGFLFAPAVCYEIIFSDSLIPSNQDLPSAIINITNDTWFGKTPGTYQHLDMVRRYAIESGVPVVRANYSGISAFILSDGTLLDTLGIGVEGILDGSVWGAHNTIYRYIGLHRMMIIILLISCISLVSISVWMKKD